MKKRCIDMEVKSLNIDISLAKEKVSKLELDKKELMKSCNHLYEDGKPAYFDGYDGWWTCRICGAEW